MTHPLTVVLRRWAAANKFPTWGAAIRWLRAHDLTPDDRPTFHSVDDVLKFAFNAEIPTVKTTGAFKLMGNAYRNELWHDIEGEAHTKKTPIYTRDPDVDRRPTGEDGVTQQSMILGFVRRLPISDHLYICAKYSRGDEQMAARRALRDLLLPCLDQSFRPRYTIYMLVCGHFGRKVDRDKLADRIEYRFPAKRAAQDARGAIRRLANNIDSLLKDMAASAEAVCYSRFKDGGLIK